MATLTALFIFINVTGNCQMSVIYNSITAEFVTPQNVLHVGVSNMDLQERNVEIICNLFNESGQNILMVKSNILVIPKGVSNTLNLRIAPSNIVYGSGYGSQLLRTQQKLASGTYNICYEIHSEGEVLNEDCFSQDVDNYLFLDLVEPFDEDIIYTTRPNFIWQTTELPPVNSPNEFYRILVSEDSNGQNTKALILEQEPKILINNINTMVLYPFSLAPLDSGMKYFWQVQRLSGNRVTDQSDIWSFTIAKEEYQYIKYITLKRQLDSGFTIAVNGKLFFRFEDKYMGGDLKIELLKSDMTPIIPATISDNGSTGINVKIAGDNKYEIDFMDEDIPLGVYILRVVDTKNQDYYLRVKFI